jgi:GNAT superfamily N-acetyltransferase
MSEYQIIQRVATVEEYTSLRESVGWPTMAHQPVNKGLGNALFSVCAMQNDKVIGCGRVVGDGSIYFYVQDIIVHPDHQGKGVGKSIMDAIMNYIHSVAEEGAFIGLMAAVDVDKFYQRYGFSTRPQNSPGMYMVIKKDTS